MSRRSRNRHDTPIFTGMLPDDTVTSSTTKYVRAWRKLAEDVEARLQLGLIASGYEPGITFRRGNMGALHLDSELCRRIAAIPLPKGWKQPEVVKKGRYDIFAPGTLEGERSPLRKTKRSKKEKGPFGPWSRDW